MLSYTTINLWRYVWVYHTLNGFIITITCRCST